jgi:hypothetical protein
MSNFSPPDISTAAPAPGEWAISWRGLRFSESGFTGQHLSVLSLIAGTDEFDTLDIDPRHGHQRLMMVIAACVVVSATKTMPEDAGQEDVVNLVAQAVAEVSSAPAEEILGALTFG